MVFSITKLTSTKFIQIMTLGSKMVLSRGHIFYIGLYREHKKKIFSSETTKPSALIFVMKHYLVDLFQVCYNFDLGAQNQPHGGHMFHRGPSSENIKTFLSETTRASLNIWYVENV